MRRRGVLGVVVTMVALAGCGSGGDGGSAEADDGPGPLAELMGWEAEEPAELRRQELEVQELVVQCMREEGWEYVAVDWSAQMPDAGEEDTALMGDPDAYGEKYGYGVFRSYELYEEESLLAGESPQEMGMEFEDPNQEYLESLSEAEVAEFYASLSGDPEIWGEPGEDGMVVSPPLADQGCDGQARLEVYGERPLDSEPELQERLQEFFESSAEDPRIATAAADWLDCMGDVVEGLEAYFRPLDHPDDMYGYVDGLKMEAMGLEAEPFDDEDPNAWTEDVYTVSGGMDGASVAYVGEPEAIPEAELEELRARELELWRQDTDCRDDVGFSDVQRQVEEDFVADIRADFPELATSDAGS